MANLHVKPAMSNVRSNLIPLHDSYTTDALIKHIDHKTCYIPHVIMFVVLCNFNRFSKIYSYFIQYLFVYL
jgi:hypothetical protein